ncbi:MAG: DUF1049 domain-containing protein [Acidobacteria bacterium]|uniref:DUF1049 domain-containing protein n=1 Tax=Candidatus Polarisedimenticola svalbardensis TaxID=2886004 RepID=A0A8J6Y2U8_9BACT|nr:DUF1049 domain-containing protein [Candidatus Polarisedimenticola svalbardensis]
MRFLVIALILGLFTAILGFMALNVGEVTNIVLWDRDRPLNDIPLYVVVILSVLVGIVAAGVAAVAEGTHIRLANRRLIRQVQKMETEINYLRTQPPVQSRSEPDELQSGEGDSKAAGRRSLPGRHEQVQNPPSAPVYGSSADEDDDDTYTGGRAV